MKEFDIEDLKRENVFKAPEGFFDDMQRKVLQETLPVKTGKIIKINWAYSAAAAIALIAGLGFFINSNQTQEQNVIVNTTAKTIAPAGYTLPIEQPATKATISQKNGNFNLTSEPVAYQNKTVQRSTSPKSEPVKYVRKVKNTKSNNPELQVDQILATFTSADLADVGKNTEQDIYLDLYN